VAALNVNASVTNTPAVSQSGTWNVGITGTPAVTQSGTWTMQPGNTANTTPWLVNANQNGTWSMRTQDGSGNAIGSTSGALNVNVNNATTPGPNTPANSSPVIPAVSTPGNAIAPATPAGVNLKASAGQINSIELGTIASGAAWLKLYDSATAPTCGSGTPVKRLLIPVASTAANGGGSNITFPSPIKFTNGIGYCVTGGITDADTTALTANTVAVNIDWN
jgi:hypothetical protein